MTTFFSATLGLFSSDDSDPLLDLLLLFKVYFCFALILLAKVQFSEELQLVQTSRCSNPVSDPLCIHHIFSMHCTTAGFQFAHASSAVVRDSSSKSIQPSPTSRIIVGLPKSSAPRTEPSKFSAQPPDPKPLFFSAFPLGRVSTLSPTYCRIQYQ